MKKKTYEAPSVKKVRLVVKNSILGNCNSSPDLTPKTGDVVCALDPSCFYPPLP